MDAETRDTRKRPRVAGAFRRGWRVWTNVVRVLSTALFGTLLLAFGLLFVNYAVLSTPKDVAYRDLDPASPACAEGLAHGWTVLADRGAAALARSRTSKSETMDGDGWRDPSDDETDAIAADPAWATRLRCAVQRHVVPSRQAGGSAVDYTLGFLEFKESGEPYALVADADGGDEAISSAMLRHAMEAQMHARGMTMAQVHPVITQLDALRQRLASGSNYVLVFIHGWRHDAALGDQDVADARLYAAHAARFLAQRCRAAHRYCDTKVTAIYVGWRGARVDEPGLKRALGQTLGGGLAALSAGSTLFDRKPVAETIAASAVSALRSIEDTLARGNAGGDRNRMIVFGHSLGGDMLASGLEADLRKAVRRNADGAILPPVLGDLVVLINPAAEARKWTDIQRDVWERRGSGGAARMFDPAQRPVVVSVTSALAFPPGGLRPGDCAWIGLDVDDQFKRARELIRIGLEHSDSMFTSGVDYDFATHDLFPTFKLDFRPAGAYLERLAARVERRQPQGETCRHFAQPGLGRALLALPLHALSTVAATFPFQSSNVEETHTIGNLDPPRPPAGVLADALPSAAPFGTTHELLGLQTFGEERHNPYATLADAPIDCPLSNDWLASARAARADQDGLFWDSEVLAPAPPGATDRGKPAARFLQGLPLAGTAPITGANDPFWNVRAFDNALSRHDGYRLTSFICAMNALVMDDITADRPALHEMARDARQPGSAILN